MSVSTDSDYTYFYAHESTLDTVSGATDLRLATSGGTTSTGARRHPYFFDGFVERAEILATGLLVVARVARTRFYTPPGRLAAIRRAADPIVTSNGDRLRFESLSACCGVYCRLDALPEAITQARRALAIMRANVIASLAIKAVFVVLAPFGLVTLVVAVAADMGMSLLVTFNAMRLLRR